MMMIVGVGDDTSVIFLHLPRGGKYPPSWEMTLPLLRVIFSYF